MSRNKEKNDEVAKSIGAKCHSEPGDVSSIESCRQVCANVVDKFG